MTDTAFTPGTAHRRAHDREVRIAYETLGPSDGEPLLLIMGIGGQRYDWPEAFCVALAERGFRVTRFDNRDSGVSTRFDDHGRPRQLQMWLRPSAAAVYSLRDMADDAVAVLDDQRQPAAHIVGVSMGGMIAQTVACAHPDRTRSLTSISSTPAPDIGRTPLRTMLRLARVMKAPVTDVESLARRMRGVADIVGSPAHPADSDAIRTAAEASFAHRGDLAAAQRQTAALTAAGDRRDQLAEIQAPTLVVHGDADPMIRPVAGEATADAVPDARLLTFPGMGHDLPRALWAAIVDAIVDNAARSTTPTSGPTGGR